MTIFISYTVFLVMFIGLTLGLFFGFQTIKLI
jgi:Cytochrome B6-F complex subunit VI (PetL)|uniref:Cytochrome b6-f complex subunit 6 n=1 Tax=Thorea hispida TaxID=202687 RepID=A0A1C9CAD5_9FLOR|nr:cytochrome b6-f complex subunit VI [Thorea hispida]AOM65350.1 cytochrome b6-f complex subunit VI [Thorea hispida]